MATPTYRSVASAQTAGASMLVVSKPAGVVTDDVLVAAVTVAGNCTVTTPSGWTALVKQSANPADAFSTYTAVFYKLAGSSEPSSYTFSFSASTEACATILAAHGAVLDVHATEPRDGSGTTTTTAPSITTSRDNSLLIAIFATRSAVAVSHTPPSGYTERADNNVSGRTLSVATRLRPSAGSTGPISATASGFVSSWVNVHLALRPSNVVPLAPTLHFPTSIDVDVANRFPWTHNDPDGDGQQGYQFRYREQGTTTWTTVTVESPNEWRDVAAGTFTAGVSYEGQVRTTDAEGYGPWSTMALWDGVAAPEGPTIIDPGVGVTISTDVRTVVYSAAEQDEREWRVLADDGGAPDETEVLVGPTVEVTATSREFDVDYGDLDGLTVHTQVRVKRSGLWSPWATVSNPVSLTRPATPTAFADTLMVTVDGRVLEAGFVVWGDRDAPSGGQPAVASMDIWRCRLDTGETVRIAAGIPPATIFEDLSVESGRPVAYRVVDNGANGVSAASDWTEEITPSPDVIDGGGPGTDVWDDVLDGGEA